MPLRMRRKAQSFDVHVHDMLLRVTAPPDYYEEARASAMQFWEQLQSYGTRHREFQTSKRPVAVPDDAPAIVREMAEAARAANVGPVFTMQGALTDSVGRWLAQRVGEVLVTNGGDYFVLARKRARLVVQSLGEEADVSTMSIVVNPDLGPQGIYTTMGRLHLVAEAADSLVVVARSCIVASAAAAAASAILAKQSRLGPALTYLRRMPGVHGAVLVRGDRIGVTGGLELAA